MNCFDVLNMIDPKYALFGYFFSFNNRLQSTGDAFYEEITCKQFFLLACMNLFPESPPTANELAKVMNCSRQNVKEILTSLEKKDYVMLLPCESDKRKRIVMLTEKALQVAEQYKEKEVMFLNKLYDGVTEEEIRSTYCFLAKLEENLIKFNEEIKK
jgi:DNA-binding MarR family transcriptional regulator